MLFIGLLLQADAQMTVGNGDVLAPARAGLVQCYEPNELRKTCQSIAAYRQIQGARYVNQATVAVSPNGPVTLETVTEVVIRNDAVCGSIKSDEIAGGTLRMAGRPLDEDSARPLLERVRQSMAPLIGKEICTAYSPFKGALVTDVTIDGLAMPNGRQRVKWIKATDGYTVAP